MKWCATFVIYLINIQALHHSEIIKTDRLISLGSNVEAVSAINVRDIDVCTHFINHELD